MSNDYVTNFINNCLKQGVASPDEMVKLAISQVQELENKIQQLEVLRAEQSNLKLVIKRLGKEPPKSNKLEIKNVINPQIELDEYTKELCGKICNLLDKGEQVTPREIMDSTVGLASNSQAYLAIKYLQDNGVLKRTANGLALTKGQNWSNRP